MRYEPNRGEAYASVTSGLYGEEMDGRYEELVELENGARKHWADKLRALAQEPSNVHYAEGLLDASMYLDPYSGYDRGAEFARTEYTGNGWVKP